MRWRSFTGLPSPWGALLVLATAMVAGSAGAADPPKAIEGRVVALDEGDIVVDIAAQSGAKDGDVVELWRPLELTHPVTRKKVSDRFLVGKLKLHQVREKLSLATAEGTLSRSVAPGDVVVLRRAAKAPEPATTAPGTPPAAAPAVHEETEADRVAAMFESLRGASINKRVAVYEDYVRQKPTSPYAPVLYEEAMLLRKLLAPAAGAAPSPKKTVDARSFAPPDKVLGRRPLTLAIEIGGDASGVVLHTRQVGEVTFRSVALKRDGESGYWSVTLPAERVRGPHLDYFIEASRPDGSSVAVIGVAENPRRVEVFDAPEPKAPDAPIATFGVWSDYADYNRMRGNDVAWQTEGQFGLRFSDIGVRALRTGFGVYRGVGGSLEDLDELEKRGRAVGLTYGYLEGELGFHHMFGVVGRLVIGLKDSGVAGGGQVLLRIGNDLETNLMLGGELLGGVGLRGFAQLDLAVFERFPMMLRSEVTNQPAGAASSAAAVRPDEDGFAVEDTSIDTNDIGARAIVQVGYRPVKSLTVAVRGSYQGRTIKHSGPGFGGAVSFTW